MEGEEEREGFNLASVALAKEASKHIGPVLYKKCLFLKAIPEPVFKYFSKLNAKD